MEQLKIGPELKNYRVIFRDTDVKSILISERQHDEMWEKVNNGSREDWIRIKDSSNGDTLFEGKLGAIVKMEALNTKHTTGRNGICMFGNRHDIMSDEPSKDGRMDCDCKSVIGCNTNEFQEWIQKNYPKIMYDGDITDRMRAEAQIHFRKENERKVF